MTGRPGLPVPACRLLGPARALLRNRCNLEEAAASVMQTRRSGVPTIPDQVGFSCHIVRVHQLILFSLWLEIKSNMNLTEMTHFYLFKISPYKNAMT